MRTVTRDGICWFVSEPSKTGPWYFWSEFEQRIWEQETLDIVDRFVTDGSTMIDVGSFIAPIAMWAADRHDARVISVEPDPVALDYAYLNVLSNHLEDRITVVDGAISDHTGTTHIAPHEFGWGSTMTQVSGDGLEVDCWTLPDLFTCHDVDPADVSLVKIDVEGHECVLLEHVAPFLASHNIPLFVSAHEPWWTRQVDMDWFSGYSHFEGNLQWFNSLLCLP